MEDMKNPMMSDNDTKYYDIVPDGDLVLVLYSLSLAEKGGGYRASENGQTEANNARTRVTGEIVRSVLTTERRPMARVRVSSHHLLQVSHVFRLMIQNARQEGKLLSADEETSSILALQKPLDIPLLPREGRDGEEDPDPEVFVLVMSIVHLRSSSIPRVVSLDMLTRVAVVVERFALHEAVGFVTQTWIEHLLKGGGYDGSRVESRGTEAEEEQIPSFAALPSEVNGDLVRWMFVATVFGLDEVLRCLENVAATGARSRLDYWNFPRLPVPEGLVDRIDLRRQHLVRCLLTVISSAVDTFTKPHQHLQARHTSSDSSPACESSTALLHCFQQRELCDLAVLGSLVKGLANHGLYPAPREPFEGYAPDDIIAALGTFVLGNGGKCVASGFSTCGNSTLAGILQNCEMVRAEALREAEVDARMGFDEPD